MSEASEALDRARAFAKANAVSLAAEILYWHRTGLLGDGLLREMAAILQPYFPRDDLAMAENLAKTAGLERLVELDKALWG